MYDIILYAKGENVKSLMIAKVKYMKDITKTLISEDLFIQWEQLRDEGKDVSRFEEICRVTSEKTGTEGYDALAEKLVFAMQNAKTVEGYQYDEPSELESIRALRPEGKHGYEKTPKTDELEEKIRGGWLGRIAGCLLGKPVEGFTRAKLEKLLKATNNYPLSRYIKACDIAPELMEELGLDPAACWADKIGGTAPLDDDTNYTVLALRIVEYFGRDFTYQNIADAWLGWLPPFGVYTAERAAYRNMMLGIKPPATAAFCNPYREWIGAQIRADLFGYICPGDCEKAACLAWRDASVSHVKNGIYGEMFVSAMISAAAVCADINEIIESGLREIPARSRLAENIRRVIKRHAEGARCEDVIAEIHTLYDETDRHGWCHVIPNAMIVTAALLYGNGDYARSVCTAVGAAFDTDCNGATVGSILGVMNGAKSIPREWTDPFGGKLTTAITGMNEVTVDELVSRTLRVTEYGKSGN